MYQSHMASGWAGGTSARQRKGIKRRQITGRGNIHIHCVPPRNDPGETVYPRETLGISFSGPKDKIGGFPGMPVPIPGLKVGSDIEKVKFLTIFGRPKTGIFR